MDKLLKIIEKDAESICSKIDLSEVLGKKILLTGASGLIGIYLAACLNYLVEKRGGRVEICAVMQNSPLPYQKKILDNLKAEIFIGDLANYNFCLNLPSADFIIHAAGYGQPGKFMADQIKTLKLNTLATFALFEKLSPDGKFLYLSSSEVYSGLLNSPYKETDIGSTNTDHPRSCYIEAKRCGEAICQAYRSLGINAKSTRLSLAYGPGTKPNDARALNNFIQKGLVGEIKLLDSGQAKRTYCYVADAVEILWRILLNGKDGIYNVGGTSKITIAELARLIGQYLKVPVRFPDSSNKAPSGNPDDVRLDLTKIKEEFGKKDFVPLEIGLKNTIEWQRELYKTMKSK